VLLVKRREDKPHTEHSRVRLNRDRPDKRRCECAQNFFEGIKRCFPFPMQNLGNSTVCLTLKDVFLLFLPVEMLIFESISTGKPRTTISRFDLYQRMPCFWLPVKDHGGFWCWQRNWRKFRLYSANVILTTLGLVLSWSEQLLHRMLGAL
jgi:hypothetical protein